MTAALPLHRRLAAKLALTFAACVLAVVAAAVWFREPVQRWFGVPTETDFADRAEAEVWAQMVYLGQGLGSAEAAKLTKALTRHLNKALRDSDRGLVWRDAEGTVLYASLGLPWKRDDRASARDVERCSLPAGRAARCSTVDVKRHGEPHGSVHLLVPAEVVRPPLGPATDFQPIPEAVLRDLIEGIGPLTFLEPAAFPAQGWDYGTDAWFLEARKAQERVLLGIVVCLPIALGALLGLVVTLVVTRRLARIARRVAGEDCPKALAVARGRDEIGVLAAEIETQRQRVASLVADLEARDLQRRDWIAQVSHDLRTPLTALLACQQRIDAQVAAGLDPGESLAAARLDLDRLRELVDDLFESARLDAGAKLSLEEILPEELVSRSVLGLRPLAEGAGVGLRVETNGPPPSLRGDGHLLKRALENLVRNAIRHARTSVVVRLGGLGDSVRFAVVDDGEGFPQEGSVAPVLAGRSLVAAADRTGLGLRVAAQVVAAHGGELTVSRPESGGSEFAFRLAAAS